MSMPMQTTVSVSPDEATFPLVLALDIGTSSVRALLFDARGLPVEGMAARATYPLRTSAEGAAEADAVAMLDAAFTCIDGVLARAGALSEHIAAVAVDTLVSNVLGVDEQGRAITPVYTYADTRPAAEVEVLRQRFDERAVHRRTGCRFHTSYLPARFLWLQRTQPDAMARAWRWVSIGEYLELTLFGRARVSYSVASWTGLLDRHRLQWDADLLAFLPIDEERLSPLVDVGQPLQGLRSPYAQRWPALRDVPWFPAVGDGAAANVGSGCVTPARVALTVGTTSAMRVVTREQVQDVPWGLWCYRVDASRSLVGGALSEGGNIFTWMRNLLRLPEGDVLDAALDAMEPASHGLVVLPFIAGERSPGWHEDARATIHGLTQAHTPLDILRAGLEAVAYRLATVFDLLAPLLPENVQVVGSGGGLHHSRAWVQIMADAIGRPLGLSAVEETAARGAALLALESLGVLPQLESAPLLLGETFHPRAEYHARHREARARQDALYRLLLTSPDDVPRLPE